MITIIISPQCAGGLASGLGVLECARKECKEEASVDDETLKKLKPVGAVRFANMDLLLHIKKLL